MTAKELMKPRYEVIASVPNNDYGMVGDVFTVGSHLNFMPAEYPHLFRKLDWWEYRSINDFPNKLKHEDYPDTAYSVERWDNECIAYLKYGCMIVDLFNVKGWLPCD